jgi:hypothetical protein
MVCLLRCGDVCVVLLFVVVAVAVVVGCGVCHGRESLRRFPTGCTC